MMDDTEMHLNSLDPAFAPYAIQLITILRQVGVPVQIISGRRSPGRNAEVGGATRSRHLNGLAVDLQIAGFGRDQIPFWIWQVIGQWWESLGGRWGGRFSPPDVNHFDAG